MARFDCPAHLKPLLDAYIEVTGLAVSYTIKRKIALQQIHDLGFGPDDVRAVLRELQRRLKAGMHGYTDTSLSFGNAIEKVDTFEERVLLLRQRAARRRGSVARPDVAHEKTLPTGEKVTVLAPEAPVHDVDAIGKKVADQLKEYRRKHGGAEG